MLVTSILSPFPQCFLFLPKQFNFSVRFILLPVNSFILDFPKIMSFAKDLRTLFVSFLCDFHSHFGEQNLPMVGKYEHRSADDGSRVVL